MPTLTSYTRVYWGVLYTYRVYHSIHLWYTPSRCIPGCIIHVYTGRATRDPRSQCADPSGAGGGHSTRFERACATGGARQMTRGRRPATALSGPMPTAGSTRSGSTRSGSTRSAVLAAVHAAGRAHATLRPPASAHTNARAPAALPICRRSRRKRAIDKRWRSGWTRRARGGRGRRTKEAVDTTAMNAKAAAAKDTPAAGAAWRWTRRRGGRDDGRVAAEAATQDPQPAAQGTGKGQLVSGGRGATRR